MSSGDYATSSAIDLLQNTTARSSNSDRSISPPHAGAAIAISPPDISQTVIQPSQGFSKTDTFAALIASSATQEDLAQQIQAFYDQWIIILRLNCNLFDFEKFPVINAPFEEGVAALQKCFRGLLPSTLGEIFSLLLVASVALVKVWHSIGSNFHATFFENALEWHHAIPNRKEKQVFFKGIDYFFRLQPNYTQWQANRLHPASKGLDQIELLEESETATHNLDRSMHQAVSYEDHMNGLVLPEKAENLTLLQKLKKGCVLIVCTKLLNREP